MKCRLHCSVSMMRSHAMAVRNTTTVPSASASNAEVLGGGDSISLMEAAVSGDRGRDASANLCQVAYETADFGA